MLGIGGHKVEKPRLKKLKDVENFQVFIVDGEYIRKNLNEEFTNFGQHYRFKNMIPANEFWIDKETHPNESDYYIKHMLSEHKLMQKGKSYNYACRVAGKVEEDARKGAKYTPADVRMSPITKAGSLSIPNKDVRVWLVNGNAVRNLYSVEFTEGGHGYIYDFIPKDEIWVDNDLAPEGRAYVILHEAKERNLMRRGLAYDRAHQISSLVEKQTRKRPSLLREKMATIARIGKG